MPLTPCESPSPVVRRLHLDAAGGMVRLVTLEDVDGTPTPLPVLIGGEPAIFSVGEWRRLRAEGDRAERAAELETPRRQRELTRATEGGR